MDKAVTKTPKTRWDTSLNKGAGMPEMSDLKRLVLSGAVVIVIAMVVASIVFVRQINALTDITRQLYLHPLAVSNATLQMHSTINEMEAVVANAVSDHRHEEIGESLFKIIELESRIQKNIDILADRFLGGKEHVFAIQKTFSEWSENCNQAVRLVRDGKGTEAITLHKRITAEADQLEKRIDFFTFFALQKATEFKDNSERQRHDALAIIFGTLALGVLVSGLICLFIILKLSRAHARLLASEESSREIVENALDAIISINDRGIITQFNPAAEHIFGYRRRDIVGKEIPNLVVPLSDKEDHIQTLQYFIQLGEGAGLDKIIEVDAVRADGTDFPAEMSISKIHTSAEYFYTAHIKDISARKASMIQVVMSELRTRRVIDHITDGVLVVDPEGLICFANPGAVSLLGLSEDNIIGHEFGIPLGHEKVLEVELIGPKNITAEMRTDNIQWEGKPARIVSLRDISDRKEVDRERLRVQKMDSLGSLAGGVAHDINNMLLPILNLTAMVANKLEAASPERKKLDMVLKAAQRMKDMAAAILAFSREDKDEPSEIDLFELFRNAVELMASTIPSTIRLNTNLDPATGKVWASRERLEAVLMNMYTNAIYAMEGHPGSYDRIWCLNI